MTVRVLSGFCAVAGILLIRFAIWLYLNGERQAARTVPASSLTGRDFVALSNVVGGVAGAVSTAVIVIGCAASLWRFSRHLGERARGLTSGDLAEFILFAWARLNTRSAYGGSASILATPGDPDNKGGRRFVCLDVEITPAQADVGRKHVANSRRRVSLDRALRRRRLRSGDERVVVLEGGPGSGKTTALMLLACATAARAGRRWRRPSEGALYVDLRGLNLGMGDEVEPDDVVNVDRYVTAWLTAGEESHKRVLTAALASGRWTLLFDSFDEIPALTSAANPREAADRYSVAIRRFAEQRGCPAIIASRPFNGPPPGNCLRRWRILPLSDQGRRKLTRQLVPNAADQKTLLANLSRAGAPLQDLSRLPLLLTMLCQQASQGRQDLPGDAHVIIGTYVLGAIRHHVARPQEAQTSTGHGPTVRTGLPPYVDLRVLAAEQIAALMTDVSEVGGAWTRSRLRAELTGRAILPGPGVEAALDLLAESGLGYQENTSGPDGRAFRFVHRRVQEYFATCAILRDGNRLPFATLLLDARWHEVAVAMLGQGGDVPARLWDEAGRLADRHLACADGDPAATRTGVSVLTGQAG